MAVYKLDGGRAAFFKPFSWHQENACDMILGMKAASTNGLKISNGAPRLAAGCAFSDLE